MKIFKLFVSLFIFTFILSAFSVNADSGFQAYAGVTLSNFNNEVRKGPKSKTEYGRQYYENYSNINSCTGNENAIAVSVESEGKGRSNWIEITKGAVSSWNDSTKTYSVNAYNIYIKNNVWSPCQSYHNGIWYYNASSLN